MRRLATGGTSDVLLARAEGPHGFERTVVLKLLLQQFRRDQPMEKMFAREAAAYARLSHPAIVKLYDFFSAEGQLVMVLEYIDGLPLNRFRAILRKNGEQVDDRSSIFVASRVFAALAAAHGARDPETGEFAPVIHRDVNPSNILIPWDGHVKLADFGIAKVAGVPTDTQSGFIKGTYGYMAPEQVRGEQVTVRTDVYAASLLLWELLARRKAVQRGALPEVEVLRAMASPTLPSLDVLRPDLPQRLRETIARGLEPSPEARSVTAEEMLVVLRESVTSNEGRNVLAETLTRVRQDADATKPGAPGGAVEGPSVRTAPRAPPRMQSEASIDGKLRTALGTGRVAAVGPGPARGQPSLASESKDGEPSTTRDLHPPATLAPTPRIATPLAAPAPAALIETATRRSSSEPAHGPAAPSSRPRDEKISTLGYGQPAPPPPAGFGMRPADPPRVLGIAPVVIVDPPPPSRPTPPPVPPPRSSPKPLVDAVASQQPKDSAATPRGPAPTTSTQRSAGTGLSSAPAMPPPPIPTPPVMAAYAPPQAGARPPPAPPPPAAPIPTPYAARPAAEAPPRHFFSAPPTEAAPGPGPAPKPVTLAAQDVSARPGPLGPALPMPAARLGSAAPLPRSVRPAEPAPRTSRTWVIVGALAIAASIAIVVLLLIAEKSPASGATGRAALSAAPSSTPLPAPAASPSAAQARALAVAPATASAQPAPEPPPAPLAAATSVPTAAPARTAAAATAGTEGDIVTPARLGGHRVFVDGRYAGDSPGPIRVKCGAHSVKLGSHGAAHSVTVPCGGQASLK